MVQVHVPQGVEVRVLSWAPPLKQYTENPAKSSDLAGFFAFMCSDATTLPFWDSLKHFSANEKLTHFAKKTRYTLRAQV